jgi:hypothetical protein
MREILLLLFVFPLLIGQAFAEGILHNSGSSSEDSLSVMVLSLDSLGRPTPADSFFVLIVKSDANGFIFHDSGTAAMAGLDTVTLAGQRYYYYHRAVADIDGSGATGIYSGIITAKKNTGSLLTPNRFSFQIADRELSDAFDSAGIAAVNSAKALDSLNKIIDSVRIARQDIHEIASHTADSVLTDSLHYQGSCSGTSGSGSGAYSFGVVAYDSSNHQTIGGVNVAIRNLSQSALIAVAQSNNNGMATFNLDASSYLAIAEAPGYMFQTFDTLGVLGAGVDTVFGNQFDPGSPASPSLCRVYGYIHDLNGSPAANATITAFIPSGAAKSGELIIAPGAISTVSDSLGYFALDLIPSDSLNPSHTKYEFTISRADGTILRQRVRVPAATAWRLDW